MVDLSFSGLILVDLGRFGFIWIDLGESWLISVVLNFWFVLVDLFGSGRLRTYGTSE